MWIRIRNTASQSPAQKWSACVLSSVADPDLNPDPLTRGMDPDLSITKQKIVPVRKTLIPTALRLRFDFYL